MKKWMSFLLSVLMTFSSISVVQASGSETSASTPVQAIDYVQQISSISDELEEGRVIINGKDANGQRVCGWMYEDGRFEVCPDYTALYPLAGGNLLAVTEDVDSSPLDLSDGGVAVPINEAGVHGKILSAEGEVLYEQAREAADQKLYRIDADHILVLSAHVEGDEVVLEAGELDADGQWILPMSSELTHQSRLESYLEPEMDPDGYHWSLADNGSRFVYKGVNYQTGKSSTLQFVDCSDPEKVTSTARQDFNMTFSTKMNAFMLLRAPIADEKATAFFDEISDEVYVFQGVSQKEDSNGLTFMSTQAKDTLFENIKEPVEVMGHSSSEGFPVVYYWSPSEKVIYTVKTSDVLDEVMHPSILALDDELTQQICGTPVLSGEQIALVTSFNENDPYSSVLTVVDLEGNVQKQETISYLPVHGQGMLSGDVLVLQDQESGALRVVDLKEMKLAFGFDCRENESFSEPRILFDKFVTFRMEVENEIDKNFLGLFDGEKEIQKTSEYFLIDPKEWEDVGEPWVQLWDVGRSTEYHEYYEVLDALRNDASKDLNPYSGYGYLCDLDDNGIEEMIVVYNQSYLGHGEECVVDVYTYEDGSVVQLIKEEQVFVQIGARDGTVSIHENQSNKSLILNEEFNSLSEEFEDLRTHYGNRKIYVFDGSMCSLVEIASSRYDYLPNSTQINKNSINVTINGVSSTLEAYLGEVENDTIIASQREDFLSIPELYNRLLGRPFGNDSIPEQGNDNSSEDSHDEENSTPSDVTTNPPMTSFSDDELVSYSWNKRSIANSKWDGQGEIPNGTEYLGQIHFTRDDGTYINYAVFRQYGIFKGQYNSFIWWGRRGSISGMMEARDSGLLWQVPGLSSYYSYYGVGSLNEFYNYMLVNELNKGYTAAYCDVEGLPL